MSDRQIYCVKCNIYLGVIRDAKIMVGITYCCPKCSKTQNVEDDHKNNSDWANVFRDFGDLFGGTFRK